MTKEMLVLIGFVVYVLITSLFIEPNSLETVKYEIEDNQLQGIKVAFLSDFHLKRRDYKRLDKIIKYTNSHNPDIVLLGGDFANGKDAKSTMLPSIMASKLSLMNAPTYAVLGHNDWLVNGNEIKQALRNNNIRVLDNSNTRTIIKSRYVDIIGIADITTQQPKIAQAFRRTGLPRIVITHNPDIYYDIIDSANIIFAGHTHGGQFVVPFAKPMFVQSRYGSELASGLVKKTRNKIIISKGLGLSGIPMRFNCKPEVTIVNFVKVGATSKTQQNKKSKYKYFH